MLQLKLISAARLKQTEKSPVDSCTPVLPLTAHKALPAPVFLPGESHGQRSLADYSLWGRKRVGHDLATKNEQKKQCLAHQVIGRQD